MAREYALYKGDKFIDLGTCKYLAEKLGVTEKTIIYYASPAHRKKTKDNALIVIKISGAEEVEAMLKIKDDVDLKELEKFGFKSNKNGQYKKRYTLIYKNRKISGRSGDKGHSKLYTAYELFDLIQAGLVEKVESVQK